MRDLRRETRDVRFEKIEKRNDKRNSKFIMTQRVDPFMDTGQQGGNV